MQGVLRSVAMYAYDSPSEEVELLTSTYCKINVKRESVFELAIDYIT